MIDSTDMVALDWMTSIDTSRIDQGLHGRHCAASISLATVADRREACLAISPVIRSRTTDSLLAATGDMSAVHGLTSWTRRIDLDLFFLNDSDVDRGDHSGRDRGAMKTTIEAVAGQTIDLSGFVDDGSSDKPVRLDRSRPSSDGFPSFHRSNRFRKSGRRSGRSLYDSYDSSLNNSELRCEATRRRYLTFARTYFEMLRAF